METSLRLQHFIAKAGVASRRHSEQLIVSGQVKVNGETITQLGTKINPRVDKVEVQGRLLQAESMAYVLFNKPKGYVTTASDPEGRATIFDLLKQHSAEETRDILPKVRLFAVGRLDYNTEGALLLTNDGDLALRLMHPRYHVEKLYHAKFKGLLTKNQIQQLRQGITLPARKQDAFLNNPLEETAPAEITLLAQTQSHTWLEIILHEGKNRQIHRMAEAIHSSVLKLARLQYAFLSVADMPLGSYRNLAPSEIGHLRQLVGLSEPTKQERLRAR